MKVFEFIIFTVLAFLTAIPMSSQTNGNVKTSNVVGTLSDPLELVILYASVALMQNDSVMVNGAISTPSGDFKIESVAPGSYKLRIEHLEYETYTTESFNVLKDENKVIPNITLKPSINNLNEVVVSYRKPMIEITADKMIFNVSSSPSASGVSGLDLLKKSPGVSLDMDNNISLLGKSGVLIYINGVQSRLSGNDLSTFLQSITSDNVESIEIISNPSAKYDAEGGAGIINIKMKKNSALGFNGSATSSFTQGRFTRYRNSVSLNQGSEKMKVNLEVTQSQDKKVDNFLDTKTQNKAILDLNSEEIKLAKSINVALGLEAILAENHTLSFSGRSVINQSDNAIISQTDIFDVNPVELSGILLSESIVDLPSTNHTLNLNHIWQINKNSSLNSAFSFGKYEGDKNTYQPNTLLKSDGVTIDAIDNAGFNASNGIDLWSGKTDYEREWEKVSISAGVKYSHITAKNSFDFYNRNGQEPDFVPSKSNDFNYSENVAALYAIANIKLTSALKLNAGLRMENTTSRGQLFSELSIDNKDVPRNYTDFFPNIGLSFDNQKNHAWSLSLGRRITRPNYQDLNPFETPISQLTVWKGNPFLRPNYIMNYQLSYAFKQKLIITNTYSVTKDFFASIFEITGDNSNVIIPRNMERATNYGVSVSYPMEVAKFWSLATFIEGAYKTFEGNLEGTVIDISATTWGFRLQNNIKLPLGITLDLTYFTESNWIWRGSIDVRGNHNLSFGLRKYFFDKKLQVRITGADILKTTNNYFYNGEYGGIKIDGVRSFDSQRFGLGVTWKFGNQQAKTKSKTNSALDDELNRIQG